MALYRLAFVSVAALVMTGVSARAQGHRGRIAFRVDDYRVIAHLFATDGKPPQIKESNDPVAKLGYGYFDRPEAWGEAPTDIRPGDQWVVHTSPGQMVRATAERFVGGYLGCDQATGVMLAVVPEDLRTFRDARAKYYIATDSSERAALTGSKTAVQAVNPILTPDFRRSLESELNQLLARELPGVRSESAPWLLRSLESRPHRTWARDRLQIEDAMQRGMGKLTYDVQSFRLGMDNRRVSFVRAQWHVGNKQGFAATMWVRGQDEVEVLDSNVRMASMMRMSLFDGGVATTHFGLILNVLDSNRDGWGELLFTQSGYESRAITLLEYSPAGLSETGISMTGGC